MVGENQLRVSEDMLFNGVNEWCSDGRKASCDHNSSSWNFSLGELKTLPQTLILLQGRQELSCQMQMKKRSMLGKFQQYIYNIPYSNIITASQAILYTSDYSLCTFKFMFF